MSSSRLRPVLVVLLALAVMFPLVEVHAQEEPVPSGDATSSSLFLPLINSGAANEVAAGVETVCALPVGDAGIHYAGEATPEMLPWGPSALTVDADNTFWVADAVANRLLHVDGNCTLLSVINLHEVANAPTDIVVTADSVWVLDSAAIVPTVTKLDRQGNALMQQPLPEEWNTEANPTGLALSEQSSVLVEHDRGAQLHLLQESSAGAEFIAASSYTSGAQPLQAVNGGLAADDSSTGYIKTGALEIPVSVANALGGLYIIGAAPAGGFYAVLDEVALRDTIVVDERIHHYAADGALVGVARAPIQEQYTYVSHAVAVAPDGNVYFLATRPGGAEIQRLRFGSDVPSIIPPLENLEKVVAASETSPAFIDPEATPEPLMDGAGDSAIACITRDTIMANARAYVNNRRTLSDANRNNRSCSGSTSPQNYFNTRDSAGYYSSVPYDWGGEDTVAEYNSYMESGKQAGDADGQTPASCSRGVDCSGFIGRVWNLCHTVNSNGDPVYPCDWWTGNLPATQLASTQNLQQGDILNGPGHVVLFESFSSNGANTYEANTAGYDRVYRSNHTWTSLNGYRPQRYNDVCSTGGDTDDGRTLTLNQTLNGTISTTGDVDNYSYDGTQGQTILIAMNKTSGSLDSYLNLYGPSGNWLASDDDSGGDRNSLLRYTLPSTGRYRIDAKSWSSGSTGGYSLRVSLAGTQPTSCGGIAESPHPYADNYNNTWTLTNPDTNATSSRVYFSRIETESGWDYVRVQNSSGSTVSQYTGNHNNVYSAAVPGRTVKIQLTTDGSITRWGFCATRIESINTGSAPAAPSNVRATALDSSRIQITWNDNSNNETGFRIHNGNSEVATTGAGATSYTVTGLSGGTYRCHEVAAFNNYGQSAWSSWACVTTPTQSSGNLARNRPASATSIESSSYPASRANDGSMSTRWSSRISSSLGDQWWIVDLGGQTYNRVVIRWEYAYAASFFVGTSSNGTSFSGGWYSASSAGTTTHQLGVRNTRYVGILMRTRAPRMNNFSIWEVEVYRDGVLVGAGTSEATDDFGIELPPISGEVIEIRPPDEDSAFLENQP